MTREQMNQDMRRHNDRDAQLAAIRDACTKANPDDNTLGEVMPSGHLYYSRPIRLADVLLAIGKRKLDKMFFDWSANAMYCEGKELWNLRQDDLTLQSDPCVAFVASLLPKI